MADNFYTLHQGHLMTYKHAVLGSHGSHFLSIVAYDRLAHPVTNLSVCWSLL